MRIIVQIDTQESDGGRTDRKELAVEVVEVVADAKGVDPFDLGPLTEAIDPDALDALVSHAPGALRIEFEYEGRTVTVDANGRVRTR